MKVQDSLQTPKEEKPIPVHFYANLGEFMYLFILNMFNYFLIRPVSIQSHSHTIFPCASIISL